MKADPHRLAEAFPSHRARPSPRPTQPSPTTPARRQPIPDEIRHAQHIYDTHVPSMFNRECLAEGCGEWPCRPYRQAVHILRDAGLLPND